MIKLTDIIKEDEDSKIVNDVKPIVISSYMAGMMQGFRMLQSFIPLHHQQQFGFTKNDGKINDKLQQQAEKWYKDNYA